MTEQDMSNNPQTSQTGRFATLWKVLRWTAISVAGVLAVLVLSIVVIVTFRISIEFNWLKSSMAAAASAAIGRPVTIEGPLTLVPSMQPMVKVEGVRIGNPAGWRDADLARLDLARMALQIIPLLKGEVLIEELTVEGLHVNLETNADGQRNWLLTQSETEPRSEPGEEAKSPMLKFLQLAELSLRDIVLSHRDAATAQTFTVELKEITGSARYREPMQLLIQGVVQDVPYEVTFNAGSLAELVQGDAPWRLEMSATAVGARLAITGAITDPLGGKGLTLQFDATGPNLKELETILATTLPPIRAFALQGRIEETDGKYRIAEVKGMIAGTEITGSFEADTAGVKPRLLGDIDIRSIDAGPLLAAIRAAEDRQAEEQGKTPPQEAQVQAAEKINVDEPVLTLEPLKQFDAQLKLTVHEVVNTPISWRDTSLAVAVSDGKLSAPVAITLAEVPFNGELGLALEDGQPKLAVSLTSEKSDIGQLAAWLTGAKGIEGKFDLAQLALSANGATIRSLLQSAELRFALAGASLSYGHKSGGNPVKLTLEEAKLRFPSADESRITARGSLLGEAFALQLKGGTFIENFVKKRWPLELTASGAGAEVSISATVRGAQDDVGSELTFALRGNRIGKLATWLGVSPQATQSYALSGKAVQTAAEARIQIDKAHIGDSAFSGQVGIRQEGETPITFAQLNFDVLDLKGLGSLFPDKPKTGSPQPQTVRPTFTIEVPILPKGIELFDSDIELAVEQIKLEAADITNVAVSSEIRDGYVDRAPIGAVIGGATFEGSFGVDLRHEVPKINLESQSSQVNVGDLMAQLGVVKDLTVTAGTFDLNLAVQGASTRDMLQRSSFSVSIKDGTWNYRVPGMEEGLDIRVAEAAISAGPDQPISLAIDGRIQETPLQIEITTDSLASFAAAKERLKMTVGVALATTNLHLTGVAPLPVQAENLHFAMDVRGERFSDLDELLDVDLPPIGPYRLRGKFATRPSGYYVENLQLMVGESTLTGKLDFKTAERPPRLDVDLVATRIQLNDFDTGDWSATGGGTEVTERPRAPAATEKEQEPHAGGRALLSPAVMRRLNGKVGVTVEEVLSGRDHLGQGRLTARLQNGRFSVSPLTLDVPGGSVEVSFALEPTDRNVALEASAKIQKLDYGILARRIDPQSETGGIISVDVDLKTRGPDLKRVMEGANGHIDFGIWPKNLDAGIFDLWAVNVISALMTEVDKDKASKINCVIVRSLVNDGVMRHRVVFADTSKMRVEGGAEVDFKQRTLDVRAAPKPKKPEFFSLAVPVGLRGQFEDFSIKINPVVLTGKALSFITSPLHVPLRRIFKKGEPADGMQACAEAWRARDLE